MRLLSGLRRARRAPGPPNGGGAASVVDTPAGDGGALAELDELVRNGRADREPDTDRRLLGLRRAAFLDLPRSGPRPHPEPDPDALEWAGDIPSVAPAALTAEAVRAGLLSAGCLLVPGLLSGERVEALKDGIDRAFAASAASGNGESGHDPYFEPFAVAGHSELEKERSWVSGGGAVWAADSPRVARELIETFEDIGLTRTVTSYLGERPALSVNKWTLRRVAAGGGAAWHQDGAFLGTDVRALNVWISLSHCGRDAPGLELVPRRFEGIVETGSEGAIFPWSVSPAVVERIVDGKAPARPIFAPGDALLFDHLMLHQTATEPGMTQQRYAIESWFFGPSAYPEKYVPLVV